MHIVEPLLLNFHAFPDATPRSDNLPFKQEEVVRIDVSGIKVSGLPQGLGGSSGRLLWTRDSKMQMTPLGSGTVGGDVVEWTPNSANGKLSLIATFDRVGDASFKKKEYDFKVQVRVDNKGGRFVTVGKCTVDLAKRYEEGERTVSICVPVKKEFLESGEGGKITLAFDLRIVPVKGLDFEEEDDDEEVSDEEVSDEEVSDEEEVAAEVVEVAEVAEAVHEDDIGERVSEVDEEIARSPVENTGVSASPMQEPSSPLTEVVPLDDQRPQERQPQAAQQRQRSIEKRESDACMGGLQQRLDAAEHETREARRMLEESIIMLEDETVSRQEAEEAAQSLEREINWLEKKAVKDRTDWENRMKDSLHKMESTVVLLETLQREKEEMEARMEHSNAESARLKELVDKSFVEQKIKAAETDAKRRAEEQAAIEVAALKKQIKAMASRLEVAEASKTTGRGFVSPAAPARGEEDQDKLEEANKQLILENQYLKIEIESLRQDASSAKAASVRVEQSSRREAEVYAQRAADYAAQLKESQLALVSAERGAAEIRSRNILLEDAVERGNLIAAELRQRLALKEMAGNSNAAAVDAVDADAKAAPHSPSSPSSPRTIDMTKEIEDVMRLMREAQDSAEARASQLASVTQELQAVSEELTEAKQHALDAQREADDACRLAMTMEEEAKSLRLELKTRDQHRKEFDLDELKGQTSEVQKQDAEQSHKAHQLAQEASKMAAALTEKLAYSNKEKLELTTRLEEARQELHKARAENDVELRKRVSVLERELVVSKNRAEVNGIFREEHDRLARELIEAKIGLAESSEELIVVKRALWKSEEKGISLASHLTKLETKFYSVGRRRKKKRAKAPK